MQAGYEEEASSKEAPQLASATAKPTRLHLVSMQIEGGWHAECMPGAVACRPRPCRPTALLIDWSLKYLVSISQASKPTLARHSSVLWASSPASQGLMALANPCW